MLRSVEGYQDPLEGSRTEVIRREQRQGRYERLTGVRVVTGHDPRTRHVHVATSNGSEPVALGELTPDGRRLLFRRTPQGLEPLWVWLSVNGLPKKPHGWEDAFDAANRRVAGAWLRRTDPEGRLSEKQQEQVRREPSRGTAGRSWARSSRREQRGEGGRVRQDLDETGTRPPCLCQPSRVPIASASHFLSSAPVARAIRNMPCRKRSGASSARTGSPSR